MAMEESKVKIDRFDGTDFSYWRMQIEDYLYQKKLHLPLLGTKPEEMPTAEWELLDRQVLGVVRLTLARNVAFNIKEETTTVGMMKALANMYEKPSASNKVYLMRRLFNLKMIEGKSIADHVNEFSTITSQLSSVGITLDEEVCALVLLSSLPDSWESTVIAVSSSSGDKKLKLNDVRDLILSEDIRRRESGRFSGSVMNTEEKGRHTPRDHRRGRSQSRGRSRERTKGTGPTCWGCGKRGHVKKECRNRRKTPEPNAANTAAEGSDDVLLLSVDSPMESWILDSGASFHSTSEKNFLNNFVSGNLGQVHLADDEPLQIAGKGDVRIKTNNGSSLMLRNVRYIPGLRRNLISIGQLDDAGFSTTFTGGAWKISKGAMIIARGVKNGTLYNMTEKCMDMITSTSSIEDSQLWHCRLGHMSVKGMKVLAAKGVLPGLKTVEFGLCEDCVLGKQKRVSFAKGGRTPKNGKLELVHTDVWGQRPRSTFYGHCSNPV